MEPDLTKYAVLECERRFRVDAVPAEADTPRLVVDRYLEGTRMRLRSVAPLDGGATVFKLGHKRRVDPADPTRVLHTSLYLDADEFHRLSAMPGSTLTKVRRRVVVDGASMSVDEFHDDLVGLVLAEVEFRTPEEASAFVPPGWVGAEVSADERFTGGHLARHGLVG